MGNDSFIVKDFRRHITGYMVIIEVDGCEYAAMSTKTKFCNIGDRVEIFRNELHYRILVNSKEVSRDFVFK